jgi:transcriptional regulator with XRE-family HTH domain
MSNERLRAAIRTAGLTPAALAEKLDVDPKTVERWVTKGRTPHLAHRRRVVDLLSVDETYLWPALAIDPRTWSAGRAELVEFYPCRAAAPATIWADLIDNASEAFDLMAYAALPVVEQSSVVERLVARAHAGVAVRVLMGDPAGSAIALRAEEEAMGGTLGARVALAVGYFREAVGTPGMEIRLHNTTLYASIYRADDVALVNTHVYGSPAGQSPLLRLRRVPSGRVFDHFMRSFERVWATARPLSDTYTIA